MPTKQSKTIVDFPAEIKVVSSKKTASLDIVYRVVLESPESSVLTLGALAPDILVHVAVRAQDG